MPQFAITPSDSGALITRVASQEAGAPRYTRKVNWRRDLSDEMRREGWDYFNPLPAEADYQSFPFPGPEGEPITLVHHVRRPNGESAVIVGTKTTLYRFNVTMDGYALAGYANPVSDGQDGSSQPYFAIPGRWQVIGSGFSPNGRRWEAQDCAGSVVFSNGVDLPVEFRVEYWSARKVTELREQGVISVGTISENNSILLAGDVLEASQNDVDSILAVKSSGSVTVFQAGRRESGTVTATCSGNSVLSSAPFFQTSDVGRVIVWSNGFIQTITGYSSGASITCSPPLSVPGARRFWVTDRTPSDSSEAFRLVSSAPMFTPQMVGSLLSWESGDVRRIAKVLSPTTAVTDDDRRVLAGAVKWDNPLAYLGIEQIDQELSLSRGAPLEKDRRQYRLVWSELERPSGFAVTVPCSFDSGSKTLYVTRTTSSFSPGDEVVVDGAGTSGGVLRTFIASVGPGVVVIRDRTKSSGSGSIQRASSIGGTAGYEDIQDDGSAILKMLPLQGRTIVYKDTNIFIARYTGISGNPFELERIVASHGRSLYYRHVVVSINGLVHFYAGRNSFYSFDLTTRAPQPVASADMVGNLFYDHARVSDTESIYAADNPLTQEIWIVCPESPAKTIAYDHVYRTFSTVDMAPSAAAAIKDPSSPLNRETSNWFVMGTPDGVVIQYGLSDKPCPAWGGEASIWYRRQARPYSPNKDDYESILSSGLIHFGDPYNEKRVTAYTLQFSSVRQGQAPQPAATVTFFAALNQSAQQEVIGSSVVSQSESKGLIPLHCIAHLIRDEVVSSGEKPVRIHTRTWDFGTVRSGSRHRK